MISFQTLYEKLVNVTQRKKMARRMSKLAKSPAFQMKKQRAMLKRRNPAKLAQVARKKTIQSFRDKFSKKAAMKLKAAEPERIKKARDAMRDDDA